MNTISLQSKEPIQTFPIEIAVPFYKKATFNNSNTNLWASIISQGLAAAMAAVVEMFFQYRDNNGIYRIRRVTIGAAALVESAANTFSEVALSSYITGNFNDSELGRGVVLIGCNIYINEHGNASAVNTLMKTTVQIVSSDPTGLKAIDDLNLLLEKSITSSSNAAVTGREFISVRRYPK